MSSLRHSLKPVCLRPSNIGPGQPGLEKVPIMASPPVAAAAVLVSLSSSAARPSPAMTEPPVAAPSSPASPTSSTGSWSSDSLSDQFRKGKALLLNSHSVVAGTPSGLASPSRAGIGSRLRSSTVDSDAPVIVEERLLSDSAVSTASSEAIDIDARSVASESVDHPYPLP
ncbi:unnamed protein product [Phytophthora fragariaefolia]|uniref:Unnamed protein product n=1 Tax=Phytophthora fragariaefolia TaxID=1490495 RepID=A0A9W7CV15_9STRA|nr:unnamed protein product [Phytophthora fragariaefolia]